MSDMFRDKEKGEEARYKLDEEQRFKVHSRRNKLLGLWAADLMGMAGGEAEEYGSSIVTLDFDAKGDENLIAKLLSDMTEQGVTVTEAELKVKIGELEAVAVKQVSGDYPDPLDSDHVRVGG